MFQFSCGSELDYQRSIVVAIINKGNSEEIMSCQYSKDWLSVNEIWKYDRRVIGSIDWTWHAEKRVFDWVSVEIWFLVGIYLLLSVQLSNTSIHHHFVNYDIDYYKMVVYLNDFLIEAHFYYGYRWYNICHILSQYSKKLYQISCSKRSFLLTCVLNSLSR